ncbi:MAG: virulence factor [Alphaproteobacteria bacterium]|nr:virulence factor [Alphaproteobacteria bacterium]MDX5370048.1 virulence factor [Alphaproteobacteria bacterium]MDX5464622.1 virulence factor [Alphaproteobacteria bacterium]
MGQLTVVYWRDIPAQVIARAGRRTAKRQLSERFEQAIDRCAMRVGASGTDAYLAEWRRGAPVPCEDDLEAAVEDAVARIEAELTPGRLKALVERGGYAAAPD